MRSGTRLRRGASVGRPPAVGLRGLVVLALALAAGLTTVAAASVPRLTHGVVESRPTQEFVPGEVVVRFRSAPTGPI